MVYIQQITIKSCCRDEQTNKKNSRHFDNRNDWRSSFIRCYICVNSSNIIMHSVILTEMTKCYLLINWNVINFIWVCREDCFSSLLLLLLHIDDQNLEIIQLFWFGVNKTIGESNKFFSRSFSLSFRCRFCYFCCCCCCRFVCVRHKYIEVNWAVLHNNIRFKLFSSLFISFSLKFPFYNSNNW